jgi:hypothetical protein
MAGRVIQGFFVFGGPRAAAHVLWSPPVPALAFPGHQSAAQTKAILRQAGPPAPAFATRQLTLPAQGAINSLEVDPGRLGLMSGVGKPLPDAVRGQMEAALGADFSAVRVHVGPQAERIGAVAFTLGNDLYFAPGRFQPDTIQGKQLLGHELAHVIQQRQGRVRASGGGVAVVQDRVLEAEADRLGMRAAQFVRRAPKSRAVQRQAVPRKTPPPRFHGGPVQRMLDKDNVTHLDTLTKLNDALRKLTPEVTGVSTDHFGVRGVTATMMNAAIAGNFTALYNGMGRREIIDLLKDDLANRVNTDVPAYTYDTHGDKHFPGGAHGSKFTANQATVNPLIRGLITPEIGRIRRDARGRNKNYYFTIAQATHGIAHCPNDLTIQITYKYATDEIEYHGYPDGNILAYSLATAKNGADIPA